MQKTPLMYRSLVVIFFLVLSNFTYGQKISNVDFDVIRGEIGDTSSNFFYATLVRRFQEQDTSLTNAEFTRLYYGNVFQ